MRHAIAASTIAIVLAATACGSSGKHEAATTTTARPKPITIVVTNDDGFDAPGIDAVVEALRKLPDATIAVVAPATNQSGAGDATTPGTVPHHDARTISGYAAVAVDGHPADAVDVALDELHLQPNLVVSGSNLGQNIGPFSKLSGTVGAALTAARRGIPALAASTGLADKPDFAGSAALVAKWVQDHRVALASKGAPATVTSLNVPTCTTGTRRGVVDEPLTATDFRGRSATALRCDSTVDPKTFADDVDAFLNGYAVFAPVPLR